MKKKEKIFKAVSESGICYAGYTIPNEVKAKNLFNDNLMAAARNLHKRFRGREPIINTRFRLALYNLKNKNNGI